MADPQYGHINARMAGEHRQMYMDQQEALDRQAQDGADGLGQSEDEQDAEMGDVDWHDFVVVEQIELYNDQEMNEQQMAQEEIFAAEEESKKAKMSAIVSEQVKMHMMENQELQSMPDPNMLGAAAEDGDGKMQTMEG